MVEECLQLDQAGKECLRYPITFELTATTISVVLAVVGILGIAAVIIWTIIRHEQKQQQRTQDTEANREETRDGYEDDGGRPPRQNRATASRRESPAANFGPYRRSENHFQGPRDRHGNAGACGSS